MHAFEISHAMTSDCDAIMAIETQCFHTDGFKRRQMQYLLTRAKAQTLVLTSGGDAVGYCTVLLPHLPRPARLYSLAVLPEHRGCGYAEKLIEAAMSLAKTKHYTRLVLEVNVNNQPARALYSKLGFLEKQRLSDYYADGSDAFRLQKWL